MNVTQELVNFVAGEIIKKAELSVENFYTDLFEFSDALGFKKQLLGKVKDHPIYLLTRHGNMGSPNILIASGFHGEEKAGPYGIIKYLRTADPKKLDEINISFLPIANPAGFDASTRMNAQGKNVNDGYCHVDVNGQTTTPEGEILLVNFSKLLKLAKNGFFTLHEDSDKKEFYSYTFGKEVNSVLKEILKLIDGKHFKIYPNGKLKDTDLVVNGGVILNNHDGSFEDLLFHRGVKISVVTETPGALPFEDRVTANSDIINLLVDIYGDWK